MQHFLYCDGSCLGNPGPGGWAFLVATDPRTHPPETYSGAVPNTTNNRMELLASCEAIEHAIVYRLPCPTIRSDSKYVCLGITKWLANWKRKDWRTSGKAEVKNIDLWQRLDQLTLAYPIRWEWVKGHDVGNPLHNAVDRAARQAATTLKSE